MQESWAEIPVCLGAAFPAPDPALEWGQHQQGMWELAGLEAAWGRGWELAGVIR